MGYSIHQLLIMFQFVLIISLFLFGAEAVCPSTSEAVWVELGNSCNHVSQSHMAGGMGQAQEYCWSLGGHLAEIMTMEEEKLLDSFLPYGISYWLGLTDAGHESTDGRTVIKRPCTPTGPSVSHQTL